MIESQLVGITLQDALIGLVLIMLGYAVAHLVILLKLRGRQSGHADIGKLQAEVNALRRRLDALESVGVATEVDAEPALAAYDYAVQYARQGMIAPEIAARCGISRDEAALIVTIHRPGHEG